MSYRTLLDFFSGQGKSWRDMSSIRPEPIAECECREKQIAVLVKAAQDAAVLLDELKSYANTLDEADQAHSIIERIYRACEAVQIAPATPAISLENAL